MYFIPFCITCLLHYDFHQNTPTGLLLVIMKGRQKGVVRAGERRTSGIGGEGEWEKAILF